MNDIASVIIETIFNMFSMFAGVWFVFSALEPKFGFKKSVAAFTIILSVFIVAVAISKAMFNANAVMNVKAAITLAVTILMTFAFTRSKLSRKIIVYLIFSGIGAISDCSCVIIVYIFTGKIATDFVQNSHEVTVYIIIGAIINTTLIYAANALWKKFVNGNTNQESNKKSIIIALEGETAVIFITIFIFSELFIDSPIIIILPLMILFVSTNVLLYIGFKEEKQRLIVNQQLEILNYQRELELDYYNKLKDNIDTIRKYRHDINNMLTVTEQLIKQPDTREKAEEFFESIKDKYNKSDLIYYCNNPILNTIIYENSEKAKSLGIDFSISAVFPADATIDDADLCALSANLIDNAFEAATATAEKKVSLNVWSECGFIFFKVQNSCDSSKVEMKNNKLKTTKVTGDHGLGTQIIDSIVEKYDGDILRTNESNVFTCVATVKI